MEKKIIVTAADKKYAEECLARGDHKSHAYEWDELIAMKEKEEKVEYETAYDIKRVYRRVHA